MAYLGVKDFVIIDPDHVEDTNLNRLIGATLEDVGKSKVSVFKKIITNISTEKTKVKDLHENLRNQSVFDELKQVDVIFGCVDNDGPRLILNELALSYLIHYIDCGSGINVENSRITFAGGQVIVINPDGPCLHCAEMIDSAEASENLTPKNIKENQKTVGYVQGADITAPSVVSLNGVIASVAVTEFIKLATAFETPRTFTAYDMVERKDPALVKRIVRLDENCLHHTFIAIGDKISLERYIDKTEEISN